MSREGRMLTASHVRYSQKYLCSYWTWWLFGPQNPNTQHRDARVLLMTKGLHDPCMPYFLRYTALGICKDVISILGTPHPVTVYIRGPTRAIYNQIISIIQLLLGGGSTQYQSHLKPCSASPFQFQISLTM